MTTSTVDNERTRLSATIRSLGVILGDVIKAQAGHAALTQEEASRNLPKALRASGWPSESGI